MPRVVLPFFALTLTLSLAACAHSSDAPGAVTPLPPRQVAEVPAPAMERQPLGEAQVPVSPDVNDTGPGAVAAIPPPAATVQAEALDDEKILQVAHVAHESQIEQARLAEQRATDPRVRELAAATVRSDTLADRRGDRLARTQRLSPHESAISVKLKEDARQRLDELGAKAGPEFDRAYLDAQLATQRQVLDLIDDKLLPNASSPEVKALVRSIRPDLARRYDRAHFLYEKLDK